LALKQFRSCLFLSMPISAMLPQSLN